METKMSIMFFGKKSRTTKHQLLPIYVRVTIEKRRFEAATHQHVKPSKWLAAAGRIRGKSETKVDINMAFDLIKKEFTITGIAFTARTRNLQ